MFIDAENRYSAAQALTATAVSTNIIDHGVDREIGVGEPMVVMINVNVVADDTTGDETYNVKLQVATDAAFTSPVDIINVDLAAGSVAGTKVFLPVPATNSFNRFSRLTYTLAGTTPTVTVTSDLVPHNMAEPSYKAYADAITIS